MRKWFILISCIRWYHALWHQWIRVSQHQWNKEETVIFQGSKLTISAAMVLILSSSKRFSLSTTAISNLLLLIHLMLHKNIFSPSKLQCVIIISAKLLFKVVDHSLQNCPTCGYDLLVNSSKGYQRVFYCNKGYFIEFPIINQILSFFRHVSFYESLQYRFKQNKRSLENIKDIYDWLIYQKHF